MKSDNTACARNVVRAILSQKDPPSCSVLPLLDSAASFLSADLPGLHLSGTFVVVGDLHGDIESLLRILDRFGYPPDASYLFLGDYVDRGAHSCRVLFLLLALKVLFPDRVFVLRGNHESRSLTSQHGFLAECLLLYSRDVYDASAVCFDAMPLFAIVNSALFCVHGGIPVDRARLKDVAKPVGDAFDSLVDDLLWSDPTTGAGGFADSYRGRGHLFGADAVREFLEAMGLRFVVRSHEMCMEGYDYPFGPGGMVMTVFSCCGYCGYGNDSGVVVVGERGMSAEYFSPLTSEERERRRVIWPEWMLDADGVAVDVRCRRLDSVIMEEIDVGVGSPLADCVS